MRSLKSWWYRGPGFTNFGDELGAEFLRLLGHEVELVPFSEAEILTSGSILQRHNYTRLREGTIIWGTGWHKEPLGNLPLLDVRAVRGQLTASQLGVSNILFGDPGLLASYFYPLTEKKHRLGFVRHYVDNQAFPNAVTIDTTLPVEEVCRAISECEAIISSSLHGCIVAASYGIPYMRLPHKSVVGGDTKWIDFTTSLTQPITTIQQQLIEAIQ